MLVSSLLSLTHTVCLSVIFLMCMFIKFLFFLSISQSSSFVPFKNGPEYIIKGTAQVYNSLKEFLLQSLILRSFLVLLKISFVIFSFISACLMESNILRLLHFFFFPFSHFSLRAGLIYPSQIPFLYSGCTFLLLQFFFILRKNNNNNSNNNALSPLQFVIAIIRLTHVFRKCTDGYKLTKCQVKINVHGKHQTVYQI